MAIMRRPLNILEKKILNLENRKTLATVTLQALDDDICNTNSTPTPISPADVRRPGKLRGRLTEALQVLSLLDCPLDICTYISLLQGCTKTKTLAVGKLVHAHINETRFVPNIYLWNTLVNMYAKCGSHMDARRVFDQMPTRDVFSWTVMISIYARHGVPREALKLFYQMEPWGIQPNQFTFASVLTACAKLGDLEKGRLIHHDIIRCGFECDVIVGNALLDMYAKCGSIEKARNLFDKMPTRDEVSWNAMIAGYTQNGLVPEARKLFDKMNEPGVVSWTVIIAGYTQIGDDVEAIRLFMEMKLAGVKPDSKTFATVLPACANSGALEEGREIHYEIIQGGFQSDVFVANALVDMYAKCGNIETAREVFNKMCRRDAVSWNAMIAGYAQNAMIDDALKLFQKMPQRHKISWNTMIAGYVQNGRLDEALELFQKMPEPDVISWTTMISGYTKNGRSEDALKMFTKMRQSGIKPNLKTFASVLPACANLAALELGTEIHEELIRSRFQCDVVVNNALIDMYAKCGSIEKAHCLFNQMYQPNIVSWTTMIAGYAMHGYGKKALKLFEQMQHSGMSPDEVTFVCVLAACCHAGLVEDGRYYFDLMSQYYHITPTMEHYGCMVDLLGRAGCLDEAYDFINRMPIEPDATVWGCLLSACKIHNKVDLAERMAEHLFELDPENSAPYVLLSNIYAAAGRLDDISRVRKNMNEYTVKKMPGCSWIEVNKEMHAFVVGDRSHSQTQKIYAELQQLSWPMKTAGYVPNATFMIHKVDE